MNRTPGSAPGDAAPPARQLLWLMLLYFGEARQRTVEEYNELFGGTGFELTRVIATPSAFSIVEARPV